MTEHREDIEWNPRYVAYARSNDLDPAAMHAEDQRRWPGGCMAGFMIWIGAQWAEWRKVNGRGGASDDDYLSDADHASFDRMIGA